MRELWLDYLRPPATRLGWALLLLGTLVAATVLTRLLQVTEENARLTERVAALHSGRPAPGESLPPPPAVTARAWDQLFAAFEAAGGEDVTLLSLRAGAEGLRATGEARSLDAVADYTARLLRSGRFAEVQVTRTEVQRQHPQRPVRFALVLAPRAPGAEASAP